MPPDNALPVGALLLLLSLHEGDVSAHMLHGQHVSALVERGYLERVTTYTHEITQAGDMAIARALRAAGEEEVNGIHY